MGYSSSFTIDLEPFEFACIGEKRFQPANPAVVTMQPVQRHMTLMDWNISNAPRIRIARKSTPTVSTIITVTDLSALAWRHEHWLPHAVDNYMPFRGCAFLRHCLAFVG
jgi:hypothetical protein